MADSFRERLEGEVPDWVEAGIVEPKQAQRILERYASGGPSRAGSDEGADRTSTLLYGTAAVLLGAAAIAFVLVGIDPVGSAQPALFFVGLALVAGGSILYAVRPERALLVDALLAAALAPLAAATFDAVSGEGAALGYAIPALLVPAAYLVWRFDRPFLPTLSVIGFSATAAGLSFEVLHVADETSAVVSLVLQAALLAALVLGVRMLREEGATTAVSLAVLALAVSLIPFFSETVDIAERETVELALGGVMVVLVSIGVGLRDRGLVLGAAIALGIDAIVVAFDVGGVFLGSALLVGLAIVLIVQAETVKGWVEQAA